MKVDLILKNGNIRTMDLSQTVVRWVAIHKGKIVSLGDLDGNQPESDCCIDLNGRTVLPGFIDTHTHGSLTGISLSSIDVREDSSLEGIFEKIRARCQSTPTGGLVTVTNLAAENLKENRFPTRKELDKISSLHPIQIHHVTMHGCVLNSLAMEIAQVDSGMRGVETYDDGSPNGILSDDTVYFEASNRISASTPEATIESYITSFTSSVLPKGVTTVHSLDAQDLPGDTEVWHHLMGTHPVHVVNYVESLDVDHVRALGYPRVGGCICLDGSRIMRTMALNQPYEGSTESGALYYDDETIYRFMSRAHSLDMQFAMHAAGDRAIDQYLRIYQRVVKEQGRKNLRHRIEHFSLPSQQAIELAAEYQIALPMQPAFAKLWDVPANSVYEKLFGRQRADRVEPFREILAAGCTVCGGSDSPVTPIDPLGGIHALVNSPHPQRTLDITSAIKLFTINGAWAAHEETQKGTIEVGKLADLVVLSKDPYLEQSRIKDIPVEITIVEGKIAFAV